MPVKEILQLGNPALREVSELVEEPDSQEIAELGTNLQDTLLEHRRRTHYGRGIAAPQTGSLQRVIHVELEGSRTLINPVVTERSDEMMEIWDACFSYFSIFFPVKRHVRIEVKYQDLSGRDQRLEAAGHLSELLQHEIDHLDGILAIDLVTDPRRICTVSEWEKRFASDNERIVDQALKSLR